MRTSFHYWTTTDGPGDQCFTCGVAVDYDGEERGPIPPECPGPEVAQPHHFVLVGGVEPTYGLALDCAYCGYSIYDDTVPADVEWECAAER